MKKNSSLGGAASRLRVLALAAILMAGCRSADVNERYPSIRGEPLKEFRVALVEVLPAGERLDGILAQFDSFEAEVLTMADGIMQKKARLEELGRDPAVSRDELEALHESILSDERILANRVRDMSLVVRSWCGEAEWTALNQRKNSVLEIRL